MGRSALLHLAGLGTLVGAGCESLPPWSGSLGASLPVRLVADEAPSDPPSDDATPPEFDAPAVRPAVATRSPSAGSASSGLVGGTTVAAAKVVARPVEAAGMSPPSGEPGDAGLTHWLYVPRGTRHNVGCRYYGATRRGRPCGPDEGSPCQFCGG